MGFMAFWCLYFSGLEGVLRGVWRGGWGLERSFSHSGGFLWKSHVLFFVAKGVAGERPRTAIFSCKLADNRGSSYGVRQ